MKSPLINFYLIKKAGKAGAEQELFRLIMSVSFNKKRLIHYTGILSNAIGWNKDLQEFNGLNPDYLSLNAFIRNLKQNASNIYLSLLLKNSGVDITDFREQLKKYKISPGFELVDAFIQFMELNYRSWSDSSYKKCRSLLNHLVRFRKEVYKTFVLELVDEKFMNELVNYFRSIGLRDSSIIGYINNMNWFLNWCVKKNLMINTAFRNFDLNAINLNKQETIRPEFYLNRNEINLLFNEKFDHIRIERVRDMFLFMIFSGCRFSEMISLKKENIKDNTISISGRYKRNIPQNNYTRKITDRYKNIYYRDNRFFPAFSNITFNKYLRILSDQAGFDRMVTVKINGEDNKLPLKNVITVNTAFETYLANCILMDISHLQIQKWTGRKLLMQYKRLRNKLINNEEAAINKLNAFYEA